MSGLEVNRDWWECRHSPPIFLPLLFSDEEDAGDGTVRSKTMATVSGMSYLSFCNRGGM